MSSAAAMLLPLLALAAPATHPVELYAYLGEAQRAVLLVEQGGEPLCQIDAGHDVAHFDKPLCGFSLATQAGELVLRGRIAGRHWDSGKRGEQEGERRWRLLDFARVSAPLARRDGDYGERFAEYAERLEAFGKRELGEQEWHGDWIEPEAPATAEQLEAASTRLGYALPADYAALLRRVGGASIGDNAFTAADELRDGFEAMVKDWGTPRESMNEFPPATIEFLRSTTLVFTEVGDGLGGLFYRPGKRKGCSREGTFYWYHQESGEGMERVRNAAGDCADFAESIWWLLEEYVQAQLEDEFGTDRLLVDSNIPGQALVLSVDPFSDAPFGVELAARWRGAHANRPFDATQTPVLGAAK
jgi:hypothetical protein